MSRNQNLDPFVLIAATLSPFFTRWQNRRIKNSLRSRPRDCSLTERFLQHFLEAIISDGTANSTYLGLNKDCGYGSSALEPVVNALCKVFSTSETTAWDRLMAKVTVPSEDPEPTIDNFISAIVAIISHVYSDGYDFNITIVERSFTVTKKFLPISLDDPFFSTLWWSFQEFRDKGESANFSSQLVKAEYFDLVLNAFNAFRNNWHNHTPSFSEPTFGEAFFWQLMLELGADVSHVDWHSDEEYGFFRYHGWSLCLGPFGNFKTLVLKEGTRILGVWELKEGQNICGGELGSVTRLITELPKA